MRTLSSERLPESQLLATAQKGQECWFAARLRVLLNLTQRSNE